MSTGPVSRATAATASFDRTSSLRSSAPSRPSSLARSRSVAQTFAPSATKACAIARPMPCPAAVTSADFPLRRRAISPLSIQLLHHVDRAPIRHLFHALNRVAVSVIPADVPGELLAGVEPHGAKAKLPGAHIGGLQHARGDALALRPR